MDAIRFRRHTALYRAAIVVTVGYLLALALIAFWPTPVDKEAHVPLVSLLGWLQGHGAPGWLTYTFVEFSANIVLFVPVGLLAVILLGARRWWCAIVVGFVASCGIELGQLLFLPARYATSGDVIANTLGAALGTVLALALIALVHFMPARTPLPPITRRVPAP
ncbi:VanZ family protein [Cryobacterium sp. MLB-32]|uniref:VanZ family protein n=1 Tax=Cryobacterium sp. MLB-32 TaxID=1529318 RepID=UPI00068FBB53|nr:VanZ family protein [Cryobacterium sp. MLB-32]